MASTSQFRHCLFKGDNCFSLASLRKSTTRLFHSQTCPPLPLNVRYFRLASSHVGVKNIQPWQSNHLRSLSIGCSFNSKVNDDTEGSNENEEEAKEGSNGNEEEAAKETLPLIAKANLVLNENSHRREKIANAVADFAKEYSSSTKEDRRSLFLHLISNYGVSKPQVSDKASTLLTFLLAQEAKVDDSVSQRRLIRQLDKLRQSLVPAYDQLFTAISSLDNGVKLIIDMRSDLLSLIASSSKDQLDETAIVHLRDLDRSLKELLSSWFSVGLLKLETVDWRSPCDLLQKVSEYERVHPVRSWADLKQRVGPYRRCFIFTHSSMPRDPVMVLNTYLSDSITRNLDEIISRSKRPVVTDRSPLAATADFPPDESPLMKSQRYSEEDPKSIQAAVFYSISNTQAGLKGVDLGHYLIKNACKVLQQEFPHLSVFSTLSPIHGFKEWFMSRLAREIKFYTSRVPGGLKTLAIDESIIKGLEDDRLFTSSELKSMMTELMSGGYSEEPYQLMLFTQKLQVFLSTNKWYLNCDFVNALEGPLQRLCVRYLYLEKHRGFALNPIANFHLRNGATLWRLNWLSDVTPKGLGHAFGMMVNYRYFPEKTERNNRKYVEEKVIDISEDVLKLLSPQT